MNILFRGFCEELYNDVNSEFYNKWIEGDLIREHIKGDEEDTDLCFIKPIDNCFCCEDSYIAVKPETVGQWTGHSVHEVKVYKDDIIKAGPQLFVIIWYEEDSAFMAESITSPLDGSRQSLVQLSALHYWGSVSVVGNKFENPELLKG